MFVEWEREVGGKKSKSWAKTQNLHEERRQNQNVISMSVIMEKNVNKDEC